MTPFERIIQKVEQSARSLFAAGSSAAAIAEQSVLAVHQANDARLKEAVQNYYYVLSASIESLKQVQELTGLSAAAWDDLIWQSYVPQRATPVPSLTRVGTYHLMNGDKHLDVSSLLPILGGRNLLIRESGPDQLSNEAVQAILLRLLATLPPGKVRFVLIDPVDRGRNLAGFMHLADYHDALVDGQVWTETGHIQARLEHITEHMDMVIQKYLRNQYKSMEEYNGKAGEVEEPYRIVVAANFPAGFTDDSALRLLSIARSGPSCGVYVIVTVDMQMKLPYNFHLEDLEQTAWCIQRGSSIWQLISNEPSSPTCELVLDAPPSTEIFDKIVHAVGREALLASRVEVPFSRICPPLSEWGRATAMRGLSIPIGRVGAQKIQSLELGQGTAQHVLVAGKTGSGKSTLFHVMIANLALAYSPDEVQVYLIDFKEGVEFKVYAEYQLPHARVIAIESEREFGLSAMQGLEAEIERRGQAFRDAGVDHLSDYRKKTGKMMPRLLLIVDEFQQFFIEDDVVASQASRLLDRLVRQGRSFGIHVILGSQSLAGAYSLARSTIDQMAVRIALQCSDADSRLILSDENNAARLLDRPGEAIYNDTNGLVEGNIRFQTVWLPDDEQLIILKQVSQLHSAVKTGWRTVVFEGRELARFDQVLTLESQLVCRTWQAAPRSLLAWLGEPIAISDQPLAARLQPQSRANLLIVGQDESAAVGMLTSSVISLALQASPDEVRFCLLDLTTADMDNEDAARRLVDYLPHPIQVVRRNREIELLLDELGELVRSRQEEITSAPPKPAIFLVVLGLHRAHNLRRAADNSSWYHTTSGEIAPPPNPAERFATLLQDGPEIGVHTLAWCSTFASLERTLDRRSIAEFGLRVAMQMNAEASTQLLDSSAASKLGANRAIFFDEEQIGRLQKFRPFAQPAIDWLEALSERLQQWVVRKTE